MAQILPQTQTTTRGIGYTPQQAMTPAARSMIGSGGRSTAAAGLMTTSATPTGYEAPSSFNASPSSLFSSAGLGVMTPSIVGGGQQEQLFSVAQLGRKGGRVTGSKYTYAPMELGAAYNPSGYSVPGYDPSKGSPIFKKGLSWEAYENQLKNLENEFTDEEARWKGRLKQAPTSQPVKARELPNEPTVKTIESESTIRSLPKDYSNVYGMGPTRRPLASTDLGQGNYRLF